MNIKYLILILLISITKSNDLNIYCTNDEMKISSLELYISKNEKKNGNIYDIFKNPYGKYFEIITVTEANLKCDNHFMKVIYGQFVFVLNVVNIKDGYLFLILNIVIYSLLIIVKIENIFMELLLIILNQKNLIIMKKYYFNIYILFLYFFIYIIIKNFFL